jgi:hypothetical protein
MLQFMMEAAGILSIAAACRWRLQGMSKRHENFPEKPPRKTKTNLSGGIVGESRASLAPTT